MPNDYNGRNASEKREITVTYVYDEDLAKATTRIPHIRNRSVVTHSLIEAYELTKQMRCIPSKIATTADILTFHSESYLEFLFSNKTDNDAEGNYKCEEEFGLGFDCPVFGNMEMFAKRITGGTITAVDELLNGEKLVINWCGGWHHAQRDEASGFCYINDIVIGIQRLQSKFKRILYIDLDAHHGDGVENAFGYSKKVLTLSLHNYETGYFPGSGAVSDIGFGQGKYYTVNVPLKSGIDDNSYSHMFTRVLEMVKANFPAEAIVVQLGADCLAGDPLGNSNLTEKCVANCVKKVLQFQVPTLFLGGGGYNIPNSARFWAYLTSVICGEKLSSDIPEHTFFPLYGSGFELSVTPTLRKNENTPNYLKDVLEQIKGNLKRIVQ